MREFLDYFKSLEMEIPDETKKLQELEEEWDIMKRSIYIQFRYC